MVGMVGMVGAGRSPGLTRHTVQAILDLPNDALMGQTSELRGPQRYRRGGRGLFGTLLLLAFIRYVLDNGKIL